MRGTSHVESVAQVQAQRALNVSLWQHAESVRASEAEADEQCVAATQDAQQAEADWLKKMEENEKLTGQSQSAQQHVIVSAAFVSLSDRATVHAKYVSTSIDTVELPALIEKACDAFRLQAASQRDSSARGFQFDLIAHGKQVASLAEMAPSTDFLTRAEPIQSKAPRKRARSENAGEAATSRVARSAQVVLSTQASRTETDREIAALDQNLRKKGRTSLYKTILAADSLSRAIENVFHISFLVKDGRAKVEFDENGGILVESKKRVAPSESMPANAARGPHQELERREQSIFRIDNSVLQKLKRECRE